MTDVDLGGPTFVLNDQDYQEIRKYTKQNTLFLNLDLI